MNKHTPAPWTARHEPYEPNKNGITYPYWRVTTSVAFSRTAEAVGFDISGIMTGHDAKLIAAAPDMYEALKNLENEDGSTMPATAWDLVNKALDKAEG